MGYTRPNLYLNAVNGLHDELPKIRIELIRQPKYSVLAQSLVFTARGADPPRVQCSSTRGIFRFTVDCSERV